MADYSYIGVGEVFMREAGTANPLEMVGNVSALNLSVQEDTKELKDFTNAGGGNYNEVRRISGVEYSMTAHDMSAANLAKMTFGVASTIAAGTVTNEEQTGYKGGLVPTDYPLDTTVDPVVDAKNGTTATTRANSTAVSLDAYLVPAVANGYFYKVTTAGTTAGSPPTFPTTAGGTVTDGTAVLTCMGKLTLVKDTDYTVKAAGIVLASDASFTDGQALLIDYTKSAAKRVEALLNSAKEYEVVFAGLNDARSGKAVNVRIHRLKLGAVQNLALIGEDYFAGEMSGKVLKDSTKNGTSVSQYFKTDIVD
jgi:hypothetical protein